MTATATTYRGAKEIAADIRKAVRAATKDENDVLSGMKISVRTRYASMMSAIDIVIGAAFGDLSEADPDAPEWNPEQRRWTAPAVAVIARLYELAAEGMAWADNTMHFCGVSTEDGVSAPTEYHLGALVARYRDEAECAAAEAAAAAQADEPAPTVVVDPAPARPVLHLITADEALILESLGGTYGDVAQTVAQLAVEAGIQDSTISDPARTAARFRAVFAALDVEPPA
jgi:hypothetical protein